VEGIFWVVVSKVEDNVLVAVFLNDFRDGERHVEVNFCQFPVILFLSSFIIFEVVEMTTAGDASFGLWVLDLLFQC